MDGCQIYEIINYHISNLFPKLPFKNDDRQIKFSFTLKFNIRRILKNIHLKDKIKIINKEKDKK